MENVLPKLTMRNTKVYKLPLATPRKESRMHKQRSRHTSPHGVRRVALGSFCSLLCCFATFGCMTRSNLHSEVRTLENGHVGHFAYYLDDSGRKVYHGKCVIYYSPVFGCNLYYKDGKVVRSEYFGSSDDSCL